MNTLPAIATRRRLPLLGLLGACGMLQTAAVIATALVTRAMLELWLNAAEPDSGALLRAAGPYLLTLAAIAALTALGRWLERVGAERLGQSYVHELRLAMFDALVAGSGTARSAGAGVHMVRFSNDLTAIRNWIALGLVRSVNAGLLLIGVVAAVGLINPGAAGLMAALLAAALGVMLLLGRRLEVQVAGARRRRGRLANTVAELVSRVPQLSAHGRLPRERKRLARKSEALGAALNARAFWIGSLRGSAEFAHRIIVVAMLGASALALPRGGLDAAGLIAVLTVSALLATPLKDLGRVTEYWKSAKVARRTLVGLLGDAPRRAAPRKLPPGDGELELRGLRLGNVPALPDLVLPAGSRLAVAGANGAGKSTLLGVIAGLTDAEQGQVRLDGVATSRLSYADRRRAVGIAHQHEPLVAGSISKNVRYRIPGADAEEVARACARAGLRERLKHLPEGLSTRIRPPHLELSEGEQARVRLARAVLCNPRLLVLDEIDASLDQTGRQALLALLDAYPGTVVFASHDQTLLSRADVQLTLAEDEVTLSEPLRPELGKTA